MKLKRLLFLSAFVILIFALGIAYIQLAEHDALIILHFDSYRGIDFLGSPADVFGILGVGLSIIMLNYLLARALFRREPFLGQLLAGATTFISLLIFIAVLVIISIN